MIKTILLHLGSDERLAARREAAFAIAAAHDATVLGLASIPAPIAAAYGPAPVSAELIEEEMRQSRSQAETLGREFQAAGDTGKLRVEWFAESGDASSLLARFSTCADLVVVPQEEPSERLGLADDLVISSAAQVLFIPYAGSYETIGRQVLVGWNGAREAARAMRDALPFLRRAEKVTFVAADLAEDRRAGLDSAVAYLERHGVAADARNLPGTDIEAGDVLLNAIADHGADLLVMGAYGHSRLRELVLGGATRHVLRHMTAPVLMSH